MKPPPTLTRPALRYHGGKWLLAPWIIGHFPRHRVYVEPFGGAASVLLRKPVSYAEVYNDLDDEVVGLFRVLRAPEDAARLIAALRLTPFARTEFVEAYLPSECPIERARRLVVRSFMGFGSDGHNGARPTGFRSNSNRAGTTPAHDWINLPDALTSVVRRFAGVIIEHREAAMVMTKHDGTETLHYVDPPYLQSTRSGARNSARRNYRHEMSDDDHGALLAVLRGLKGMVVLSGYPSTLYAAALPDWQRVERQALADGAKKRIEVLWLNPAAAAAGAFPDLLGSPA